MCFGSPTQSTSDAYNGFLEPGGVQGFSIGQGNGISISGTSTKPPVKENVDNVRFSK
jgi:hypothetical protein